MLGKRSYSLSFSHRCLDVRVLRGWANGIYTYRLSLLHLCIALFLSAIESHVSWKGGSILHRKCSHLATLVNLYAPWENGFCQFLMFYSIKSSSDTAAMSCSKHPWQLFEVWSQVKVIIITKLRDRLAWNPFASASVIVVISLNLSFASLKVMNDKWMKIR